MRRLQRITCLVPFLAVPFPATAQDSGDERGPAPYTLPEDDRESIFGAPLYVNGRRISDLAIQRFLCYGKGRGGLESRRLGILMQQEMELRAFEAEWRILDERFSGRAKEDLSPEQRASVEAAVEHELARFDIDMAEYEARVIEDEQAFVMRWPTLDHDTELRRGYGSSEWYWDQLEQTMRFDRMFFPDHPDTWPEISIEAIRAGAPEHDLIAEHAKYYEIRRAEAEAENRPIEREFDMAMLPLRGFVMDALASLVEVRTNSGVPLDVLMTVEGGGFRAELSTVDVYEEMRPAFWDADVSDAKLFLALIQASIDSLAAKGALIPRDEFLADLRASDTQFLGYSANYLAMQSHGFPSQEAFEDYGYVLESFRRYLEPQLDGLKEISENLSVASAMSGGKATAEVLLVSAFDFPRCRWKEDGWAWAADESMRIRGKIDAHLDALDEQAAARRAAVNAGENYEPDRKLQPFGRWWSELLDFSSEYWDRPLPVTGPAPPLQSMANRGRFTGEPMTYMSLRTALTGSSYRHWLTGSSAIDEVFFSLEPGSVGGPYEGQYGYYIVYLKDRAAPKKLLRTSDERDLSTLKADYFRRRFVEFSHAALAEAEIKGL